MEAHLISGHIGAEISGVRLDNLNEEETTWIKEAWLEHKVLVFRNQNITREQHIAFGRNFGDLEVHPFAPSPDGYPEIVKIVSNDKVQYAASNWHSDVTWRQEPSMGSILRGRAIPDVGGDTSFANTAEAYNRLDSDVKSRVDSLYAIHDFTQTFGQRLTLEERKEKQDEYPPARHPVIRTHPVTGERAIYTNRPFVSHIEGIEEEESRYLLSVLEQAILDTSIQCRIKWEVDTIVMWDNRIVQHHASNDFYPQTRRVERVTVIGDRPF
ncbi:MAG: TauD/TfdA family dioxygenase [Actinomycetota bacterium]|nr:TauD/TfdA family dioxygenase [Actinomycetota bacterium]